MSHVKRDATALIKANEVIIEDRAAVSSEQDVWLPAQLSEKNPSPGCKLMVFGHDYRQRLTSNELAGQLTIVKPMRTGIVRTDNKTHIDRPGQKC